MSSANSVPVLQSALVDLIDLSLLAKQAHWNVVGANFRSAHLQLDEINDLLHVWQDDVAERISAIGGAPDGRSTTVAEYSRVEPLDSGPLGVAGVVQGFAQRLADASRRIEATLTQLDDDLASQDVLIGTVAGLDKAAWMFRAQL